MTTRLCCWCETRPVGRGASTICRTCDAQLVAGGQRWCNRGQHAVMATAYGAGRSCLACERMRARTYSSTPASCPACHAPVAGHARCQGCTRLVHGAEAMVCLCRLCMEDRARGVPPDGYGWRDLAKEAA